jgi:hypothetical protein
MKHHPGIVVHGWRHVQAALQPGLPVTLVSAPGAALYAGCGWWRALIGAAHAAYPRTRLCDILDCADAPARALEALRIGQRVLVLRARVPGREEVERIAAGCGARLLAEPPDALDLGEPGALRRLPEWLRQDRGNRDMGRRFS